jgi:hypothetical protein
MAEPTIGKLSSMYAYAWKQGLKTTYYLRSRPATRINRPTPPSASGGSATARGERPSCSLENPSLRLLSVDAERQRTASPSKEQPLPMSMTSTALSETPIASQTPYIDGAAAPALEPTAPATAEQRRPAGPLLDPGFNLTLRPMRYPEFYDMYQRRHPQHLDGGRGRLLRRRHRPQHPLTPAEQHLINRLVAFFATGDSIVSNNLVLNLYKHINAPKRACTCRVSSTKRRCTSSST